MVADEYIRLECHPSIRDFCIVSSRFSHQKWGIIPRLKWENSHRALEPLVET